jgi:hypothetical protein
MHAILRNLVRVIFGLQALAFLPVMPAMIYYVSKRGLPNSHVSLQSLYMIAALFSAAGAIYAMALFTMRRGWPSMRIWGIAASALNLLFLAPLILVRHTTAVNVGWLFPLAGAAGFYLFLSRDSAVSIAAGTGSKNSRIQGDCTNAVMDIRVWLLASAGWIYGEIWCIRFLHENDIWYPRGLALYFEYSLMLMLSIAVHEFGHAFGGWSVGMKLRLFAFGPFSWQVRDGKWEFKFDSRKLFPESGATGNVPRGPEHQVWQSLLMIAAGPLINIGTGLIAVGLAVTLDSNSPLNSGGAMLMFGVASLVGGATNLLPFRVGATYSDGARLLQLLNGGPAADIYFAQSFISSSLVTALRPADYDMELIERAAAAAQGQQLMVLRLCQCQHYLDLQQTEQAQEAFARVESVYEAWQASVPAGLLPSMVFAAAYVKRDALEARRYWTRMEELEKKTKNPVRRNADYWIAECALHWSERRFDLANVAWQRGALLANRLPAAGAYDFDRSKYLVMQAELEQHTARFKITESIPPKARPAWDSAF